MLGMDGKTLKDSPISVCDEIKVSRRPQMLLSTVKILYVNDIQTNQGGKYRLR